MLNEEGKGISYTRQKRRPFVVAGIILGFFVVAALGIVVGYFIGRGQIKSCDEGKRHDDQSDKLRKEAVEMVSTDELRSNLEYFTKVPHFPGSKENYELAKYIRNKWKEYGFTSVTMKKYIVMLSRPIKPGFVSLYHGGSEIFRSADQETFYIPSENNSNVVTPFNAYAPSGRVKGKLVYANYGREEDFDALEKLGVNCSGKIVIMRYGKIGRATKSKRAHKLGAIGAIYYMDPQDYARKGVDKVFPNYNWMPSTGVQRGNIKSTPIRGDPQTPGYPSVGKIFLLYKLECFIGIFSTEKNLITTCKKLR